MVQAISLACPRLQLLMLGGCTIGSPSVQGQLDLPPAGQQLPAAIAVVQAACSAAPDSEIALVERVQAFAVQMCLTIAALPYLHAVQLLATHHCSMFVHPARLIEHKTVLGLAAACSLPPGLWCA